MQRALIQYRDPKNYALVAEALEKAHRTDLIGYDAKCLIRPRGGKKRTEEARPKSAHAGNSKPTGKSKAAAPAGEKQREARGRNATGTPADQPGGTQDRKHTGKAKRGRADPKANLPRGGKSASESTFHRDETTAAGRDAKRGGKPASNPAEKPASKQGRKPAAKQGGQQTEKPNGKQAGKRAVAKNVLAPPSAEALARAERYLKRRKK